MNRRRLLKGLGGVAVGLPFLESLGFRRYIRAQETPAPRRFVTFFQCNGANMEKFWPNGAYGNLTDAHFAADRTLYALRGYKDKLLIPRNMNMSPKGFGQDPNTNGCNHQKGMGHKLTAAPLDGSGFATGISVDQFIANQVNPQGRAAMTVGVHNTGGGGTGSISYLGPQQPVTSEANPRLVFQDLMGLGGGGSMNPQVEDLLSKRRKSVLDLVSQDFDTIKVKRLSKHDQDKLELHFTTIRELEMQLMTPTIPVLTCSPLADTRQQQIQNVESAGNVKGDAQFPNVGRMQMDMIALALACDHTRVATLQWGAGAGGPIFTWGGMNHQYNHHKLSHGNTRDDNSGSAVDGYLNLIFAIDKWFAGEFAYLLDRLNAYEEANGTLLDNSLAMWINELSDGLAHHFVDLPTVLAGSCGGYFAQGKYVDLGKGSYADAPHNKLLTSIANAMGAKATGGGPVTHFGDTRFGEPGEFSQLLA